ncbi:MAG: ATP-grasp domain-containing protein, partial [Cyanobacteria bacterium J06642_3]
MKSKRVGVIGGGQLAWMMAAEARKLGIELIVQTPNQNDPAVSRAHDVIFADVDDAEGTAKLAQHSDVVTFENEFVDLKALHKVEKMAGEAHFYPALSSLVPLLDKYDQRSYLKHIGIPVPQFDLHPQSEYIASHYGFPIVLKARRHGYDGQGTFVIKDLESLKKLAKTVPIQELLVEEFIPFKKELGIIAARSMSGEMAIYPVTETYQKNQVCHWTITPADVTSEVATEVKAIARKILDKLDVVGVFGIEFFL